MSSSKDLTQVMDAVTRMNRNIDRLMDASGARNAPSRQINSATDSGSKTAVVVCVVFIVILVVAVVIGAICYTCRGEGTDVELAAHRPSMIQNTAVQVRPTAPQEKKQIVQKSQQRRKIKRGTMHENKIKLSQIGKTRQHVPAPRKTGLTRSQQLRDAIANLKRPKKSGLTGGQVEGRSKNEATIGSYKTASNSNVATRKVGAAIDSGRLARSLTDEARGTVMKQGRGSRLNKEQIRQGIMNVGRKGSDPSRKVILTRGARSLGVDQESWRPRGNRKTPLTSNVPCGANPSLQFYDQLKKQQQQQAIAAR